MPIRSLLAPVLLLAATACREPPPPAAPPAPPPAATAAPRPTGPVRWGDIEGRVRLTGTPPPAPVLATSATVAHVCGDQAQDRSLVVGAEGALAHAVVSLQDGAGLPAPESPAPAPVLDQKQCSYEPPSLAARAGTELVLRNSDPLVHNVRAQFGTNRSVFNVGMPLEGMTLRRPLPATPGTVHIRCDVHPWMRAVVRTFDHPYFTTTAPDGRFRLRVPEGSHTLVFWHDRLPARSQTVTVRAGETVKIDEAWDAAAFHQGTPGREGPP
ncbi:carboxypeptidase regulatory-like domain-containing protein [Corallococcus sp. BB11-1]|uniref:carboxypeptidase regulatory-like domain-containing protein n=1 Tax=Corallococcus sp. BB11-1 TaxID=2996783 RepID=UPI00226FE1A5|nr:carboxypeptidase regulatory-like domain-containing protein [Corallococcus sp. BB11-1]MCY1035681.1 carboxypeptidase regulatory-like domain-containing protein [Corallococcus sp. BB11-1]